MFMDFILVAANPFSNKDNMRVMRFGPNLGFANEKSVNR